MLDFVEKERLRRQRARRERIGTITSTRWDKANGLFYYEVTMSVESGREEEPFTAEDHRALCAREKDI